MVKIPNVKNVVKHSQRPECDISSSISISIINVKKVVKHFQCQECVLAFQISRKWYFYCQESGKTFSMSEMWLIVPNVKNAVKYSQWEEFAKPSSM